MTFDKLLLHDTTRQQCLAAVASRPHAVLLRGKKGSGGFTVAHAMARDIGALLAVVSPKKRQPSGSYTVDVQHGSIIIDDIRALYDQTRAKFSTPHIVIIDIGTRTISPGAQNAFLKLLEEPQPNIHFIIVAQSQTHLLPTVVSRCRTVALRPITTAQSEHLLDTLDISDVTQRARLLFIADGYPAELTRLASDKTLYDARVAIVQDARTMLEGDTYTRLTRAYTYRDKRNDALQLLDDMIQQLTLSLNNAVHPATPQRLSNILDASERIAGNGHIMLQLAKVLL
ncbi:MAG: hypothetical protein WAS27_04185 [Candidatus Saccharimonadales bacterium]